MYPSADKRGLTTYNYMTEAICKCIKVSVYPECISVDVAALYFFFFYFISSKKKKADIGRGIWS